METETTETTDIFLWANNTDGIKKNLDVELFLFNKNYTPYTTNFATELNAQIKPLFLFDMINFVNMGAGTGLTVRDFELSDGEDNTLLRTDLAKVGRAETLIHVIEKERHDIMEFSQEEHEFKRIKGIVARFTYKEDKDKKPFYIIKAISQGNVLNGATSWEFRDGKFGSFQADVGLKMPDDNQVLIIDKDIFVFNQAKFEKLFNYEYKKQVLADQKVAEIEKQFKLSFPDGLDLQSLVRERKKIVNKLQKMEIGSVTQEQAVQYADDMQLELMTDDAGAIIIMDGNDLDMFVNLINEDYITSEITGKRYEIKSKKLLDDPDGEPPRG
ncbi:MAG TPA: Kiwa anti-phage protein KwaB-like domain-containing protein [Candidatus Saccharimonadales bacterium]|nr:Kiwa anti-phage protein KwaB-like domain-containing protein [Candidatus Saccharimonadales bacterium]